MSKYFIPVEIEWKWWVVEHRFSQSLDVWLANEASPKYPTLKSDSVYWASKARVKMTSDEFEVRLVFRWNDGNYMNNCWQCKESFIGAKRQPVCKSCCEKEYAIPLQSPTTKELIAGKPIISEAYNDDGTHSHWRLIDPATGDLLWTQNPEEDTHLWTGKVPFTTFALSLPKQDNGDAWDEAWHNFKRDTPHNFRNFKKLLDYFQQHYSISKIK